MSYARNIAVVHKYTLIQSQMARFYSISFGYSSNFK